MQYQSEPQTQRQRTWLRGRRLVQFGFAGRTRASRTKRGLQSASLVGKHGSDSPLDERHLSRCEYLFRLFCTAALTAFGLAACLFAVQLFDELLLALRFPVRSLKHRPVSQFEAPAIVVFMEKAHLESCNHFNELQMEFWNNAFEWHLRTVNCSFIPIQYNDPYSLRPNDSHPVMVFRGPSRVNEKETVFLHFSTHGNSQDFYTMSFLLLHNFSEFKQLPESRRIDRIALAHAEESVHTASAGLRLWAKMSMTQLHLEDGEGPARTVLDLESSLAASYFTENSPGLQLRGDQQVNRTLHSNSTSEDRRCQQSRLRRREKRKKQFFLFFEWKSGILAESHVVRTQSVWSVGASLCGVLLTLHKGYTLAAGNVRELKQTRARRHRSQQFRQRRSMQAMMRDIAQQSAAIEDNGLHTDDTVAGCSTNKESFIEIDIEC